MAVRKKIFGTIAVAAVAGLVWGILSGKIEDRWVCVSHPDRFVPVQSVWLRVPVDRHGEMVGRMRQFGSENGLLFAADKFPLGFPKIERERYAIEACNRIISVHARNSHREELFAVHVSRNPAKSPKEFETAHDNLKANVISRFARATPEEIKAAYE